ncbi:MAG: DUF3828 domain-containing protein [Pyrinomonadaceae bacterium]
MKTVHIFNSLILTICMTATSACSFGKSTAMNTNIAVNTANVAANATPGEPESGGAESQTATAAALVADLYKQHDGKKSPFFQTKNRALVDKYFTKQLADLIWKDATTSSGEVGAIDGDPLYNTQDPDIKNFAIGNATVTGLVASVPVTFTNGGRKENLTFELKQVSGNWKIDNIQYGGGDSLLKWLKETYPDKPAKAENGEFEGKFKVGDTSCTVKPVKMAFEVKWAKGSGVEVFVFKEGNTFESNDKGGPNRFEFDDENYNTGTFYRVDGKTFPVQRLK